MSIINGSLISKVFPKFIFCVIALSVSIYMFIVYKNVQSYNQIAVNNAMAVAVNDAFAYNSGVNCHNAFCDKGKKYGVLYHGGVYDPCELNVVYVVSENDDFSDMLNSIINSFPFFFMFIQSPVVSDVCLFVDESIISNIDNYDLLVDSINEYSKYLCGLDYIDQKSKLFVEHYLAWEQLNRNSGKKFIIHIVSGDSSQLVHGLPRKYRRVESLEVVLGAI